MSLPALSLPRLSVGLFAVLVASFAGGCGSEATPSGGVPSGLALTCSSTSTAGDPAGARAMIEGSASGACVVLPAGTYAGPFKVPAGVALVAQNGARARVTGGTAQDPAITLGEGSQLAGVDVVDAGGVAIAVRAASAVVSDVTVTGAKNAALAVLCREGCAAGAVALNRVTLTKSSLGLWVSGAHVVWKEGASSNHAGTGLASATGVVAQEGANLEMTNVMVEKNEGTGVLLDGAATTAAIKDVTVNENGERGVWAQRLEGTLVKPSLKLEGCQLTKNRIVGLGALESRGIIIVSGRIADTVAAPLVTNLESTESIGDGVGIFGSGDFKLESTLVESNARAAGVIDGSDRGIIIVSGKVGPGITGLKFVVQNTKGGDVQVAETDRSISPKVLGISAPRLALPPVL